MIRNITYQDMALIFELRYQHKMRIKEIARKFELHPSTLTKYITQAKLIGKEAFVNVES